MKVRASVKKIVRQMQADPPPGRGAGDLHESEAQAAARIRELKNGAYRRRDLPNKKRVEIGLTYIYGIGRTRAQSLLPPAGIDPTRRSRT